MSTVLLRLLFPSWAFFDRVVSIATLELRTLHANGTASPWRSALPAPLRRVRHLLVNPDGTEHLAQQGLVDRLATELDDDVRDPTSHALVEALARHVLGDTTAARWQWRIVTAPPGVPAVARVVCCSAERLVEDPSVAAT